VATLSFRTPERKKEMDDVRQLARTTQNRAIRKRLYSTATTPPEMDDFAAAAAPEPPLDITTQGNVALVGK
jgi:hypothetical protein